MRSPKKEPFSASRIDSKFQIRNWPSYNNALRNRGRLDFMIAEDLVEVWYNKSSSNNRGRPRIYSDKAIFICYQIRCLFGLRLRQTEGFINYLFEKSSFKIKCPDYTTLSKRCQTLGLESLLKDNIGEKEFAHVSVDSTGIQTYTGNEWLENKHGKRYIRRIWKKLHILIDDQGIILANSTTIHTSDDRSQLDTLLKGIKTKELLGDPGYDGDAVYQSLLQKGIQPRIRPPNSNHQLECKESSTAREKAVEYQQTNGYQAWRVKNNYGRREKVENTFFRFKTSFGCQFLSREEQNMANEMIIKCHLLNRMFEIGRPESVRAA